MEDAIFRFLAKIGRTTDRFFTEEYVVGGYLILVFLIYVVVDFICMARENRRRKGASQTRRRMGASWLIYSLIRKHYAAKKRASQIRPIASMGRAANSLARKHRGGEKRRAQIRRNVRHATQGKKPGKVIDALMRKPGGGR